LLVAILLQDLQQPRFRKARIIVLGYEQDIGHRSQFTDQPRTFRMRNEHRCCGFRNHPRQAVSSGLVNHNLESPTRSKYRSLFNANSRQLATTFFRIVRYRRNLFYRHVHDDQCTMLILGHRTKIGSSGCCSRSQLSQMASTENGNRPGKLDF
jgi:hypothetical protein